MILLFILANCTPLMSKINRLIPAMFQYNRMMVYCIMIVKSKSHTHTHTIGTI